MNILFISNICIAANLAVLLKNEGHDVRLHIVNKSYRNNFDNLVTKDDSWRKELRWVGKDGLIVFDDVGWGKTQDNLRKKGYKVFGGCEISDKLEQDREFGQKIFKELGLKTVELKDFTDIEDAIIFIKNNPKKWVIKGNDHTSKFVTYIGEFECGKDAVCILKSYYNNKNLDREKITLHERIEGVEMGVGRYFNGTDWVGPIEINFEHTRMFPGDVGPITDEMGTLAWYDDNEKNTLFVNILNKFKPYLRSIDFRGDFEINCIVNESGIFPLEATARFGSPIVHLQSELHISPWGEFLYAVACGEKYDLKYKKGFGVVNLIATPPFPYGKKHSKETLYGINIYLDKLNDTEMKSFHFEGISLRTGKDNGQYFISCDDGYIGYTTAVADSVEKARQKSLDLIKKVVIPKAFYRNDIGKDFEKRLPELKKWGYVK
jgi:phosphoribosylamine---glycine ligase